jgi:hypothetical protein
VLAEMGDAPRIGYFRPAAIGILNIGTAFALVSDLAMVEEVLTIAGAPNVGIGAFAVEAERNVAVNGLTPAGSIHFADRVAIVVIIFDHFNETDANLSRLLHDGATVVVGQEDELAYG